jgi:hypothetical protein
LTKPKQKFNRGRKHLKAEGVDWTDALKHALTKPKSKEPWGPNKK